MLAVSDVLTALDVENTAFRVGFEQLESVPFPFIAHVHSNGGEFVTVAEAKNGSYYLSTEKWDKHRLSADEFKKVFGGTVLVAEAGAELKPASPLTTFFTTNKPVLILAGLLLLLGLDYWFPNGLSATPGLAKIVVNGI